MLVFFFPTFLHPKMLLWVCPARTGERSGQCLPEPCRVSQGLFSPLLATPGVQAQVCAGSMELQHPLVLPHLSALTHFLVTPPLSGVAVVPFWMAFEAESQGPGAWQHGGWRAHSHSAHVYGPAVWLDGQIGGNREI